MFSHWILSNDKLQDLYLVLSDSCPLILISNCQNILSIFLSTLLYHRVSSYLSCLTVTHITSVLSLSIQSISHSISFVSFHSICRQYQSWALGPDGQAWSAIWVAAAKNYVWKCPWRLEHANTITCKYNIRYVWEWIYINSLNKNNII